MLTLEEALGNEGKEDSHPFTVGLHSLPFIFLPGLDSLSATGHNHQHYEIIFLLVLPLPSSILLTEFG